MPPARPQPQGDAPLPVYVIARSGTDRKRLGALIGSVEGLRLAGAFPNPEAAESELARRRHAVALLHETTPAFACASARKFKFLAPLVPIVVHSPALEGTSVFSILAAGAAGCVFEKAPDEQSLSAMKEAVRGGLFLCKQARWEVIERLRAAEDEPGCEHLTRREEDVSLWLCRGTEKDTALGLKISVQTAHAHAKAIYKRLRVHGRAALVSLLTCGARPGTNMLNRTPDARNAGMDDRPKGAQYSPKRVHGPPPLVSVAAQPSFVRLVEANPPQAAAQSPCR